jgi:hypothetical protein
VFEGREEVDVEVDLFLPIMKKYPYAAKYTENAVAYMAKGLFNFNLRSLKKFVNFI